MIWVQKGRPKYEYFSGNFRLYSPLTLQIFLSLQSTHHATAHPPLPFFGAWPSRPPSSLSGCCLYHKKWPSMLPSIPAILHYWLHHAEMALLQLYYISTSIRKKNWRSSTSYVLQIQSRKPQFWKMTCVHKSRVDNMQIQLLFLISRNPSKSDPRLREFKRHLQIQNGVLHTTLFLKTQLWTI